MDNELNFNNKKFLSSKRAGEIAGYTNDYVARLCRQGKVEGRMVGRTWYVEENSFFSFLETHTSNKEERKKLLAKERKQEYVNAASLQKKSLAHSLYKVLESASFLQKTGSFAVVAFFVFSTYVVITSGPMEMVYTAQRSYTNVSYLINSSGSFISQTQKLFVEQGVRSASGILVHQANVAVSHSAASVSESVKGLFSHVWKSATNAFWSLALRNRDDVSEPTPNMAVEDFVEEGEKFAQLDRTRDGVVVVPSAGLTKDEERKKEIEEAFSDEIEIIPDEDGRSGIIKPIFKNQEDQEYLYVLVPVEEDGAN